MTVEPGFVVPDLILTHYTVCGHVETELLRNYVIPEIGTYLIANPSNTLYCECSPEWNDYQFPRDILRVLYSCSHLTSL